MPITFKDVVSTNHIQSCNYVCVCALAFVFLPVTLNVYAFFLNILMRIFPSFHSLAVFLFLRTLKFLRLINNRTSFRPIQSVIILVINKSDSCCAVVRFCYHLYDYRPNWTPLSPITITYRKRTSLRASERYG